METTTKNDLVKQLKPVEKTVEQKQQEFDNWMKNKVKSNFYAQNNRMMTAYKKIT